MAKIIDFKRLFLILTDFWRLLSKFWDFFIFGRKNQINSKKLFLFVKATLSDLWFLSENLQKILFAAVLRHLENSDESRKSGFQERQIDVAQSLRPAFHRNSAADPRLFRRVHHPAINLVGPQKIVKSQSMRPRAERRQKINHTPPRFFM